MKARMREALFAFWRHLPAGLRRRAAHAALDRLRPRLADIMLDDVRGRDVPKIVAGFLSAPSGLGRSARLAAAALEAEGHRVYGIDLSGWFHEQTQMISWPWPDGRTVMGPSHVTVVVNGPYMPYALRLLGRRFLKSKYITGYWAWELERLPESWRRGFACVHDIAVPSRFVAEAVRAMAREIAREGKGAQKSVRVAPHPVALDAPDASTAPDAPAATAAPEAPAHARPRTPDAPFTIASVASIASGFARKNPLALIEAFERAFPEPDPARVRLSLLLTNTEHYPPARPAIDAACAGRPDIAIAWAPLAPEALARWLARADLYAALHRSEGFGLPLAEAMLAGIPVMATGWSGNVDFMDERNSLLVDYRLVPVRDPQGKYPEGADHWAEPDIDHAARLLRAAAADPARLAALAAEGRRTARARLNPARFTKALLDLAHLPHT